MRVKTTITVVVEEDYADCTVEDIQKSADEDPYILLDSPKAVWTIVSEEVKESGQTN